MDHIRQAVLKARDKRAGGGNSPASVARGSTAQSGGMDFDNDIDLSQFKTASCNLDNFNHHRIIASEHDPVLNSYRVLRTRVIQKMEAEGWQSIAVVSPSPSAGKTVTAINLAIAVASSKGSRVTLADLDFYRPSVARYLGVDNSGPLLDYFEGSATLNDTVRTSNLQDILLMSNERVSRRGAEFLSSSKVEELVNISVRDYKSRMVVMDTSPILGCDDTIALLPNIDCVLLVAASGQTRSSDLKEAKRLLKNTNIVGTILNKAPATSVATNYYYY